MEAVVQIVVACHRRYQPCSRNHRQDDGLGRRDGVLGSRADRQDQLGGGGRGRVFVIDDGKRQRTELARNLRRFDEIGTAPGLRHHDEQGVAKIRRPLVGRHDGRCGGGCEQAKPRFEKVAQIDPDMTGAAAPAENNDARPGPLEPARDRREHIGTREKTLGRRGDFGGLACHCASRMRFSHRRPRTRPWTR